MWRFVLLLWLELLSGQAEAQRDSVMRKQPKRLRVMSYNVENLFDTEPDPRYEDDDFTPEGSMHWTPERYRQKLHRVAEVISSVGGKTWPDVVALVEIENERVLRDLLKLTVLERAGYHYAISHSRDRRGIDVALLYRKQLFRDSQHWEYEPAFLSKPEKRSRNVLHFSGILPTGDRLHFIVCHFPSRREGARKTEPYRCDVARLLKDKLEQLHREDPQLKAILLGDFNENPRDMAVLQVLGAELSLPHPTTLLMPDSLRLYNLFGKHSRQEPPGSYYYQGGWMQLDHIIVSQSLLRRSSTIQHIRGSASVFAPSFLSEKDKYGGYAHPKRSYKGPHYMGGYSDHYPVVADFRLIYP